MQVGFTPSPGKRAPGERADGRAERCGINDLRQTSEAATSRFKDLSASLVFGLDLFKSQRRIFEHSKLKIAARSKDMSLPIVLKDGRLSENDELSWLPRLPAGKRRPLRPT